MKVLIFTCAALVTSAGYSQEIFVQAPEIIPVQKSQSQVQKPAAVRKTVQNAKASDIELARWRPLRRIGHAVWRPFRRAPAARGC